MEADTETGLSVWVVDGDFASLYPSLMRGFNISRMTLRSAVFMISGRDQSDIQNYYANLIHVRENAVPLCEEFHGLPAYREMYRLLTKRIFNRSEVSNADNTADR